MAKEKQSEQQPELNLNDINLSGQDLLKVLALFQTQNAQVLADALAKLQPGYQSPEQKQFQEQAKKQMQEIQINKLRTKKRQQRYCDHEIGQSGNRRSGEGAFCGLRLPTGETIGVCQYCQMVISSANPEHQKFFKKMNGTVAESGQVSGLLDPLNAQLARLSPDHRARVLELRAQYFVDKEQPKTLEEEEIF